ncbi:MAG: ribulose-phosphate 3-epimerase [Clostridiales bacterium]|nr:ribulose-phosphate 3-epimerase [Clostridiales bacterium]
MNTLVSASVLAADFSCLGDEVKRAERAGVDMIHLDVMDGNFVSNLSFGAPVISSIRPITDLQFDTHLMVRTPHTLIEPIADAGADIITIHIESESNTKDTLQMIKKMGKQAGLSIKPNTPIEEVYPYLDMLRLILVMTVEPGYGGQSFIHDTVHKIEGLHEYIKKNNLDTQIEVDGGINADTAKICRDSGAEILVAGTYLFAADDFAENVRVLKGE